MRDDSYLRERLEIVWKKYFGDIRQNNFVHISFGRCARKRLGSISGKRSDLFRRCDETKVVINGHFRDRSIPQFVVDATIAHELCHYAHGFCSPLPQLCQYPHRGGVIKKEMQKRGLGILEDQEWDWLQNNWSGYLEQHHPRYNN